MNGSQRAALSAVLSLGLLLVAGCGGGRSSVKGKVTWNGTPIPQGTIGFVPKDGGGRMSASSPIKDGMYSIDDTQGPNTGTYMVQVTYEKKTGKKVNVPGEMGITQDETTQVIPANYNTRTTLEKEIKAGVNELNFDLTGK